MSRVRRYAISLPTDVARALEELCAARGQTATEVIRDAVETMVRAEREHDAIMQYVRGYERMPESEQDMVLMGAGWDEIAKEYPWDDDE